MDFDQQLKDKLAAFDRDCAHNIGRWESSLKEAEIIGDPVRARACRNKIDFMRVSQANERILIQKDHETSKASILARERDFDFLRGVGPFYESVKQSVEAAKILHPEQAGSLDMVVGYVEVSQHNNDGQGNKRIVSGFTTFDDLVIEKTPMYWFRRKPTEDRKKAPLGSYLFAVHLGGLLHFIDFNPDSSD